MENVENLLKLYENLHALNKPLADLLNGLLPSLKHDWWRECVIDRLDEQDIRIINRKGITELYEFDIGILLKILIRNWQDLSNMNRSEFNLRKEKLTRSVRDIRNFTAHPNEMDVSSADYITYFERLKKFAEFIGTDIEYSLELLYQNNEIEDHEKKKKLFNLINERILLPAIECPELNQDIKESIQDTIGRLEKKNTSKEIYDFFYDALDARRGKQVYTALKDSGLNAFEDIIDDFFNIYWSSRKNCRGVAHENCLLHPAPVP
jgi:hypothetical protein